MLYNDGPFPIFVINISPDVTYRNSNERFKAMPLHKINNKDNRFTSSHEICCIQIGGSHSVLYDKAINVDYI
jgi:hypothetical protein